MYKKIINVVLVVFLLGIVYAIISSMFNTVSGEMVKVYLFEAGGCPYCEQEIEYLESLSSYNKKFTIVEKELYVDHENWEEGKDFELGKKVAEAFTEKGFTNASYYGTPFIVISNIYAATTYDDDLESVINKAYKKGDKDVVGCFESGNDNCLD